MAMRAALAAPRGLRRLFCTNLTTSSTFPFVPPPPSEAAPAQQMAEPSTNLYVSVGISQDKSRKLGEEASLRERYEQWVAKHGKVYKDAAEKEKRFLIFKDNVEYIESSNAAGNKSYTLGTNIFADLTCEEYKARLNGCLRRKYMKRKKKIPAEVPTTDFGMLGRPMGHDLGS